MYNELIKKVIKITNIAFFVVFASAKCIFKGGETGVGTLEVKGMGLSMRGRKIVGGKWDFQGVNWEK